MSTPHDPELVAERRAWLVRARRDHGAAAHELLAEPPFLADVVFHAQQEAEKALKAFLTWHSTLFRKSHNIEELGEQCLGIDASLGDVVEQAVPLTKYVWMYRYPGDPEEPEPAEAEEAPTTAGAVLEAVVKRLPIEVRP